MVNVEVRSQARNLVSQEGLLYPDWIDSPDITLPVPDSAEAHMLINLLDPYRYAALARAIDVVFDKVSLIRTTNPPLGLLPSSAGYVNLNPFKELQTNLNGTFRRGIQDAAAMPAYADAEKFTHLVGTLDTTRWSKLDLQLMGGVGTATRNMTVLLGNLRTIVAHHAPGHSSAKLKTIAKNSIGLPLKLSLTCTERMLAAECALAGTTGESFTFSDPEDFVLRWRDGQPHSVAFRDFENLQVPAGFSPISNGAGTEEVVPVADIPCGREDIIGCPLTLLEKRMMEMWCWAIDIVEYRDIWLYNEQLPVWGSYTISGKESS